MTELVLVRFGEGIVQRFQGQEEKEWRAYRRGVVESFGEREKMWVQRR